MLYVFDNPSDKMIFEGAFDDLMEKILRYHLVNIGSREIASEWL